MIPRQFIVNIKTQKFKIRDNFQLFSIDYYWVEGSWFCVKRDSQFLTLIWIKSGADPGRGEGGSSHGQIFSTLEYFALTFLKILD